jgi:TonB family protein
MHDVPNQGYSPNARFLMGDVSGNPSIKQRVGNAVGVSIATHFAVFGLLIFIALRAPDVFAPVVERIDLPDFIWTKVEGPGGGGGGGGNRNPEPPRKAEMPGKEKTTVPVQKPPDVTPDPPKQEPKPDASLTIPAQQVSAGVQELPGTLSGLPSAITPSQGLGTGGGAGTGSGTGIGPGQGSGLGPGSGGGTGGGVYRPGNGVVSPRLILEVKPNYTAEAMRAKIQGVVTLEAVVMPDGSVGNVQIIRSLDNTFGLDEEAKKTVRKWRFAPGTRLGQPVPVLVEIEITFTLR